MTHTVGFGYQIPDTRYQIPDTRYQIPDTGYRFSEVRESRGGPGDPRRVPSQRVDLISAPECEVHCVRAGGLNVPPSG